MRAASFQTADLWNQFIQAWKDYQTAKSKSDTEMMRKLELLISELQKKLEIPIVGDEFKQAA